MTRTRLRQLEQVSSSIVYEDNLNMGANAEGQPGANIETSLVADSFTAPSTIKLEENRTVSGLNADDQIMISGATNGANNGTFTISTLSYDAGNDLTVIIVSAVSLVTEAVTSALATTITDPKKNLRRDLDHIRTQLRILNQKPNWYDVPQADATYKYELKTGSAIPAGTDIVLASNFDAGEPYTLKVYLNGQLLLPSTVSAGHVVTASYDYVERDSSQPATTLELGDRVRMNFDLVAVDLLQFKWSKK